MSSRSTPIVLSADSWDVGAVRYMQPKVNDRGGKSINVISTQSNRSLHVSTPLLMTWGISDYVDEKGESDGKFSMSLTFPNSDYATEATTEFLDKLKDFENRILDDAVKYSDAWFGEDLSREVVKHNFFPFLKYSKDKVTKKVDYTKSPSIRAKVPNYGGKWNVEVYDTRQNMMFPCDNENMTPMDFVPPRSNVACVLQCGGLWFGGKGWGVTWKLNQCVVKPFIQETVYGKCHISLSDNDIQTIEQSAPVNDEDDIGQDTVKETVTTTMVEDSDNDEDDESVTEHIEDVRLVEDVEPVIVAEPVTPVKKKVVKKVVSTPVKEDTVEDQQPPTSPKKKVVRKKVSA